MVVQAKRFAVSVVAGHACLPMSMCVIVAKLAKIRVQAAARSIERLPITHEGVVVFEAVDGGRRPLQTGGSSALDGTLTTKTSA